MHGVFCVFFFTGKGKEWYSTFVLTVTVIFFRYPYLSIPLELSMSLWGLSFLTFLHHHNFTNIFLKRNNCSWSFIYFFFAGRGRSGTILLFLLLLLFSSAICICLYLSSYPCIYPSVVFNTFLKSACNLKIAWSEHDFLVKPYSSRSPRFTKNITDDSEQGQLEIPIKKNGHWCYVTATVILRNVSLLFWCNLLVLWGLPFVKVKFESSAMH